jgi:hypothetical protein
MAYSTSGQALLMDLSAAETGGEMGHGSLPLAIAPQRFPAERLGFSSSLVVTCGFVRVDSVRESGAATPGKCRRYFSQDWL